MPSETTSKIEATAELPFDFGEFSLRSIGLTINVPPAIVEQYPTLIATMFANVSGKDEVEQLRTRFKDQQGNNEKFLIATYSTIFEHEQRHFHDFLATPFGASIMKDLMLACRYLPIALNQLSAEETIALPLQAWLSLSPKLHSIYQKQFNHSIFNNQPPQTLNRITEAVVTILNRVQAQFSEAQQIMEASALAVQIHRIEELFGYEHAVSFATEVVKKDKAGTYTKIWSLFNTVANQIHPDFYFSPLVANAILFYGLCGTNKAGEETEMPMHRINSVLGYLLYSKEIATAENIWDILNHCSTVFKISTITEALTASVEDCKNFVGGLQALGRQDSELLKVDVSNKDLYKSYGSWINAYEYMAGKILADPASYCNPASYIDKQADWVAAPIYVAAQLPAGHAVLSKGWTTVWGTGDFAVSDKEIIYSELIQLNELSSGKVILSLQEANLLSQHIWWLYLVWSKNMLRPIHRNVACRGFQELKPGWKIHLL